MFHSRAIAVGSLVLALVIGLPLALGACGGDDENKAATEVTEKDFDREQLRRRLGDDRQQVLAPGAWDAVRLRR